MAVEKRKASMRGRAAEGGGVSKKRQPSPEEASSPEPSEDSLPTKVEEGQPLPTVEEPQATDLASKHYQSIVESGVLATSLQRSRHKWLGEGIFERYWTKPSKKKNQVETRNPPKDTMVKLGPCIMKIEPHIFEVTLYTVREQPTHASPASAQATQRPVLQYGPPTGAYQRPSPATSQAPHQYHSSPHAAYPRPPSYAPQPTPPMPARSPYGSSQRSQHASPPGTVHPGEALSASTSTAAAPTPPNGNPRRSSGSSAKQSPDPVIQMLAAKAATDHELKGLMRVVASGSADAAQLAVFQKHIDGLTSILQARGNPPRPTDRRMSNAAEHAPPPSAHGRPLGPQRPHPQPMSNRVSSHWSPYAPPPAHPAGAFPLDPSQNATIPFQPPPLKPKGNPHRQKSETTAVVLEFTAGSGDRFLFPKYSILEYQPGGLEVLASFLVVRKGSNSESGHYDPKLDYYQPVTMRMSAHSARILDPLSRVVASADEASNYMNDVMENMTRAEYVHLAMRLPRRSEDVDEETPEESIDKTDVDKETRDIWAPPGSIEPLRKRPVHKASFPVDRPSVEPWVSPGPKPDSKSNRKRGRIANTNKRCRLCQTTETSLWRKAEIEGENVTVCNACGIKWKASTGRGSDGQAKRSRGTPKLNPTLSQGSPPPTSFMPVQTSFTEPSMTPMAAPDLTRAPFFPRNEVTKDV